MPLFALRAINGRFVCAEGGGLESLIANREQRQTWETFERKDIGNGRVSIETHFGLFLTAESGGGQKLSANRNNVGAWEQFEWLPQPGNKVAIRSISGHYVTAENGGASALSVRGGTLTDWQRFDLVEIPLTTPPVVHFQLKTLACLETNDDSPSDELRVNIESVNHFGVTKTDSWPISISNGRITHHRESVNGPLGPDQNGTFTLRITEFDDIGGNDKLGEVRARVHNAGGILQIDWEPLASCTRRPDVDGGRTQEFWMSGGGSNYRCYFQVKFR